ncbi:unnamed protein product [Parnassius apollo]|uniref:(apollo) hypothetical protein n=1 Tax=Parnassius apollo TaxID=110799 RepID=A0A8S3XAG0_PARAO|nr:unnamed protein product [Parnassius apollo]
MPQFDYDLPVTSYQSASMNAAALRRDAKGRRLARHNLSMRRVDQPRQARSNITPFETEDDIVLAPMLLNTPMVIRRNSSYRRSSSAAYPYPNYSRRLRSATQTANS